MTAHIRKHIVDRKEWLSPNAFDSGLALCQIIPGAIVMQVAAYVGLKIRGIWGAIVCFVGFGLPAFLVMFTLSVFYKHTQHMGSVEIILKGLQVIIVAIVANAAVIFGQKNFSNYKHWIIAFFAAGLFYLKIHPALVLVISSVLGLFLLKNDPFPKEHSVRSKTFKAFLWIISLVALFSTILYFINKEYFKLAFIMLHIDLFSFGGGLASIPIMYNELVDLYGWFDHKTFMDGVILGQVTPGSIIISAAFFGYMHFGIIGSILATLCVFTPSFLILIGIIPFFDKLHRYPQFNRITKAVLCSFVGLLAIVSFRFANEVHWNILNISIVIIAFIFLLRKIDVIWIILAGIILSFWMY